MNTPDFAIFKSGHPDVLALWENYLTNRKDWQQRLEIQMKAWGFDHTQVVTTRTAYFPTELAGVHHASREIPAGWRDVTKNGPSCIAPYAKQKKLSREFAALRVVPDLRRDFKAVGMPFQIFVGLSVTTAAINMVTSPGGPSVVWVKWVGCEPKETDDLLKYWQRVPLSEYYAQFEGGRDPFTQDEKADSNAG